MATAQTNPPPASYVRSYVNGIPNQPQVTVTVSGASNVSCLTIEEDLPPPASPLNISSGGVWVPSLNAIRWGPFFNIVATNVSYQLTGMPASYAVNGGSWMDGQWYFSPGVTMVTVLPTGGGVVVPTSPPQVALPSFIPISGASVPTNVTISCATPGAVVYYTLDGSLPTTSSLLYTGAVYLTSASTVRAVAFTNGWTPSASAVAYYGPPAATANAQLTRSVNTNSPTAPVVTFNLVPGTNAACVTVTETLPLGLSATNVMAGGNYIASNNAVLWGPFFGTNAQMLSYQAVGLPGTYAVQATWSVDGVGGVEAAATSLVLAPSSNVVFIVPNPPLQAATPVFSPASGSNVPVNVAISCATPGAVIYYTLDGSLPTMSSQQYTSPVYLATASTIRAVAFTNGWTSSASAVAYYGPAAVAANAQVTRSVDTTTPSAPLVTFSVVPGANANCVAVTESLPLGLGATNITAGGTFIASNNVVLWGPFFGMNAQTLSYQAIGLPGTYPVQATWSVDGVSSSETMVTEIVVTSTNTPGPIPPPPPQESTPVLSPAISSNLPVTVSISSSDPQAQIRFTTDGTLPTQNSSAYTTALTFRTQTTLRAVAFRAGYLPSVSAVGNYVPLLNTNSLTVVRTLSGDGLFIPSVTLSATPSPGVNCYSVTESIVLGLTPDGLATNAVWNPASRMIQWGPFFGTNSQTLSYQLIGPSGSYALTGQGSFDGYSAGVTGSATTTINAAYSGTPNASFPACATEPLTYNLSINPAPNQITVTSASGTLDWGDGTQSAITQPVMTFQKQYATAGTYVITISADWTGFTSDLMVSGQASKSDTVQVVSSCAPVIVSGPTNQVVLAGAPAQFSVNATSVFPMSYQWYFNQSNPIFSPATFATLTLPDVSVQAGGVYSVIVSNAYGSATSSAATLTVIAPLVTGFTQDAGGNVVISLATLPISTSRIWATTNLTPPVVWQVISTNASDANGQSEFTDTNAIGYPTRFYRFSTP